MGPLQGYRVVEVSGIGPGPFACMLLADMGAEIIRIDRTQGGNSFGANPADIMGRGRESVALDLKSAAGLEAAKKVINSADILVEGFRPGVMEKLGLGPDVFSKSNKKLVYGRMTGWGQTGPLAQSAGHDINYIALTGALSAIGTKESGPVPPLNLLGDFGGGSLYLVMGILAAVLSAQKTGEGQVVDAAIVDGAASLMTFIHMSMKVGFWEDQRQSNMLDGGAHYYGVYECSDSNYISIGSIEPQFYHLLLEALDIPVSEMGLETQFDKSTWPALKTKVAAKFKEKTRAQWCEIMEGTDICFAPVLNTDEAVQHPHSQARGAYIERDGIMHPAPAPRFSKTESELAAGPVAVGQHTAKILTSLGYSDADIEGLIAQGSAKQV